MAFPDGPQKPSRRPAPESVVIRPEHSGDGPGIYRVHAAAFPTDAEARLVSRLLAAGRARVSLVAETGGIVGGHILFTEILVAGPAAEHPGLVLAPLAVLPSDHGRGIGSALVREGLSRCRGQECAFVVVYGSPRFYTRFGFRRASDTGIRNDFGADESYLVLELAKGSLPAAGGLVRYAPEFAGLRRARPEDSPSGGRP